jgi:hypothetical protein
MGFLRSTGGDGTGVQDRSPAKIAPQEFAGDIERLACGLQECDVGGEDVHHALPDVKFGRGAGFRHQIGVSARIVEQDLVLANVRNAGLPPERRIDYRIGIHLGDVVEESRAPIA